MGWGLRLAFFCLSFWFFFTHRPTLLFLSFFLSGIREKTSTRDSRDKNVLRIHVSKKHARRERSLSGARVERQGGSSSNKASRSLFFFRFFFSPRKVYGCAVGQRRRDTQSIAFWCSRRARTEPFLERWMDTSILSSQKWERVDFVRRKVDARTSLFLRE